MLSNPRIHYQRNKQRLRKQKAMEKPMLRYIAVSWTFEDELRGLLHMRHVWGRNPHLKDRLYNALYFTAKMEKLKRSEHGAYRQRLKPSYSLCSSNTRIGTPWTSSCLQDIQMVNLDSLIRSRYKLRAHVLTIKAGFPVSKAQPWSRFL